MADPALFINVLGGTVGYVAGVLFEIMLTEGNIGPLPRDM